MYLDFAATSKISQIWINSIIYSNSKGLFGNPGSYHKAGFDALEMMETSARNILNDIFKDRETADQYDICFNSGSTESINQFFNMYYQEDIATESTTLFIYENIAHKAVHKCIEKYFPLNSFKLDFSLSINENLKNLNSFLNKVKAENKIVYNKCILVLTSVNNETGGIWKPEVVTLIDEVYQNYRDIKIEGKVIKVFLDHTQGFMKHNENLELADAFCFSAHKIGGMKGFGGLVYKKDLKDSLVKYPLIVGGYEMRGGTKDPISVKALDDLVDDKYIKSIVNNNKIEDIYSYVVERLKNIAEECKVKIEFNQVSDFFSSQSPYIINASFIGIEGESLMSSLMDDCISTGSACNSAELKTSHVLSGLGIPKLNANCAFRISLVEDIDQEELDDFLDNRFKPAIKFLARMRTRHGED